MADIFNEHGIVFRLGDCRKLIRDIPDASVEMILTDPPYFIDCMGEGWSDAKIAGKTPKKGVVTSMPKGMRFDRRQGRALQDFMEPLAREFLRVLVPGGFCAVFSQGRLYHRMAMALDLAGFEIRDMLAWKREGQPKAFSQDHFIKKDKNIPEAEKERLIAEMSGWKTPQLKPQIEPVALAQKPREGTFVDNWVKYGTGLLNADESLDGRFPGNVMEVSNRGGKNGHPTEKPVKLLSHLIRLFTKKGQSVLDPFMGSGSAGIACLETRRRFIGFELEPGYMDIAIKRVGAALEKREA